MELTRSVNYDVASRLLTMINQEAAQSASNNLQSSLVHLEDVYCGLLNCVYGWHLVNANAAHKNYPGIDLIDESALLCVQVTADTSSSKMRDTLAKPVMERLAEKGYTLKFCYVGEQNKNTKNRTLTNPYGIKFQAHDDVILTADLLSAFCHMNFDQQEKVLALLKCEMGMGFVITAEWMTDKLNQAIALLGPRYTPEANVETPDMKKLAALAGDERIRKELVKRACSAVDSIKLLLSKKDESASAETLQEAAARFTPLLEALEPVPGEQSTRAEFEAWVLKANSVMASSASRLSFWEGQSRPSRAIASAIEEAYGKVRLFEDECMACGVEYLAAGSVLVCGEAGIGKSYLLADLCKREIDRGNVAILLLGSQFYGSRNSEEDIPNILGVSDTLEDFLAELQRYAEARDGISLLVIDALNEGNGRFFWKNALPNLLNGVASYSNVRIVLSVRKNYIRDVLPEMYLGGGELPTMECEGFGEVSSVAIATLCEHHGIPRPLTPLIGMEFSNPLYLTLLCRHISERGGRFSAPVAMADLVKDLLEDVNYKLAGPSEIGYDSNIPLATRAVEAIVGNSKYSFGIINYEAAAAAVVEVVRDYVSPPGLFLEGLVSEGLFNVIDYQGERALVFSYELVGNYVAASVLISRARSLCASGAFGSCSEAISSLLVGDWKWLASDPGALVALSATAPGACHCEIYEFGLEHATPYSLVEEAFVDALPWRAIEEITPPMDDFIRDDILAQEYSMREFLMMSFQLSTRRQGIDAWYYRDLLLSLPMPTRDYAWSSVLARSGKANSFVDWAWENGNVLGKQQAESVAVLLALCLAATNVLLRRKAIKALALTLIDRPYVAEHLWVGFSGTDDDYILEGLCGALYGAAVNSSGLDAWAPVVDNVYESILGGEYAYPNIAVRDYAQSLRDLIANPAIDEMQLAAPFVSPWHSEWYAHLPSNDEIDGLLSECREKYGERSAEESNTWWLIHSMTTEYGRGICPCGDFGRYVLGHRISSWANQFASDQLLSNVVTAYIMKNWYSFDLHTGYDTEVCRFNGRAYAGCERIGKKYQKIGMNRLVARLMDNYPPYQVRNVYKEGYGEYSRKRADLFVEALASGDYDKVPSRDKDSEWLIGEQKEPLSMRDVGWELLSTREHDPSFPWRWSTLESPYSLIALYPSIICLDGDPDEWCRRGEELDLVDNLRVRKLDGRRFYTLGAYVSWSEQKLGRRCREATWLSGAVFVKGRDVGKVYGHYSGQSKSLNFFDVRFGECFNGRGFRVMDSLHRFDRFEIEKKVSEASYLYDWDEDRVDLEGEAPSVYLPSEGLVRHFGLKRRGPWEWVDGSGSVASYCLVDQKAGCRVLLFDADMLDDYLSETAQVLIWDDYFEKQTARLIYRKWINVSRTPEGFRRQDSEESYCGEIERARWMGENDWVDA